MSQRHMESFDSDTSMQTIALAYEASSHPELMSRTTGRTGQCGAFGVGVGFFVPISLTRILNSQSRWIVGMAIKRGLTSGTKRLLQIIDSGTVQVEIRVATDGTTTLYNGSGTLLSTMSNKIDATSWHYLEVDVTIASSGAYVLKFDGSTDQSGSGTTKVSANASADRITFGMLDTGSNDFFYIDDLYIYDASGSRNNAPAGPMVIEYLPPSAAGNTTQLTPHGAGSNYACVNEGTMDSDGTYVSGSTINNKDTYTMSDLASGAGTVLGAQVRAIARKDDLSTRSIIPVYRSGGADYDGSPMVLTGYYAGYLEEKELDPATGNPFTISGINGLELGPKISNLT